MHHYVWCPLQTAQAGCPTSAGMFLYEIHEICKSNGLPPLNALAVNAQKKHPGHKYPGGLQGWEQDVRYVYIGNSGPRFAAQALCLSSRSSSEMDCGWIDGRPQSAPVCSFDAHAPH